MLDKYIIKACEVIDNVCEWIANKLAGPRCKCGKKKKDAQTGQKMDCKTKNVVCRFKRASWKTMGL